MIWEAKKDPHTTITTPAMDTGGTWERTPFPEPLTGPQAKGHTCWPTPRTRNEHAGLGEEIMETSSSTVPRYVVFSRSLVQLRLEQETTWLGLYLRGRLEWAEVQCFVSVVTTTVLVGYHQLEANVTLNLESKEPAKLITQRVRSCVVLSQWANTY